jgi:HSP20 family molecular chaperone IbpA
MTKGTPSPWKRGNNVVVRVDSQAKATFRHGLLEITAPRRLPNDGKDGRRLEIEIH